MSNRPFVLITAGLSLLISGVLNADTTPEASLLIKPDSVIGSNIGHFIDNQDKHQILQTLSSGRGAKPSVWKSASSGIVYTVTPDILTSSQAGACRDFTLKTALGSFLKEFPGRACRERDGQWVVLK